jgi:hypothetical protein
LPDLPLDFSLAGEGAPDPNLLLAGMIQERLSRLWGNPYGAVEVEALELHLSVVPDVMRYRVEGLTFDRTALRAGQQLEVSCVLRKYRGETVRRLLTLEVPRGLLPGTELSLVVGSPARVDRTLGNPVARRAQTARDVSALVRAMGEMRSSNRLTAVLYRAAPGVVADGAAYDELPPTAARLLLSGSEGRRTAVSRYAPLARAEIELDGPVDGGATIELRVDHETEAAAEEEQ